MKPEIPGVVPSDSLPKAGYSQSSIQKFPSSITEIQGRPGDGPRPISVEPYASGQPGTEDRPAEKAEQPNDQTILTDAGSASPRVYLNHPGAGFDLDGVIASESGVLYELARLTHLATLTRYCHSKAKCLIRPEQGIIISCRRKSEWADSFKWLWSHGIKLPLLLCTDVGEKALRINELGLRYYYENERHTAYRLALLCPRTIIRLTGEVRD